MPKIKEVEYVWMDGEFVKWDEARVPVMTHCLHYGTGVFEGIRGYSAKGNVNVFRLEDHMKRLYDSAKIHMMDVGHSVKELCDATVELIKKNNLKETCYVRPLVYRGFGEFGINPAGSPVKTAIIVFPFGKYLDPETGAKCCISSWRRIAPDTLPPEAKACGNYINSVLAKTEAVRNGYDEAIMLDMNGYVSEGSGENIFIMRRGTLLTPSRSSSILEGITRHSAMTIAKKDMDLEVIERTITRSELYVCDEAFFTGTAAEITPIMSVDGRVVGNGKMGAVTRDLQKRFFDIVEGKSKTYSHWLTPVY